MSMTEQKLLKRIKRKAQALREAGAKIGLVTDIDIIKSLAKLERMKAAKS